MSVMSDVGRTFHIFELEILISAGFRSPQGIPSPCVVCPPGYPLPLGLIPGPPFDSFRSPFLVSQSLDSPS